MCEVGGDVAVRWHSCFPETLSRLASATTAALKRSSADCQPHGQRQPASVKLAVCGMMQQSAYLKPTSFLGPGTGQSRASNTRAGPER